jgi:hypothetical protein
MKFELPRAAILAMLMTLPALASAQDVCSALDGAIIIAQDPQNTYLGRISSSYDSESIFNEYGTYGNEYSSKSIWNEYSRFGNEYNGDSPFNEYSSSPPMIIKNRSIVGYLTTNEYKQGAISPNLLKALCK